MTLPGLGAINNDDRNVYCDPLNLSHVTKRYLKTKLQIYSELRQWHMHCVVARCSLVSMKVVNHKFVVRHNVVSDMKNVLNPLMT